jgi:hypothetical protein
MQICWQNPTQNIDGTPVDEPLTIQLAYGPESGNYLWVHDGPPQPTCRNLRVAPGVYYVVATATDVDGRVSRLSNEVVKEETRLDGPSGGHVLTD